VAEMSDAGKLLFATDGKLVYHPTSSALLFMPAPPAPIDVVVAGLLTIVVGQWNFFLEYYYASFGAGTFRCTWRESEADWYYYARYPLYGGCDKIISVKQIAENEFRVSMELSDAYQGAYLRTIWEDSTLYGTYTYVDTESYNLVGVQAGDNVTGIEVDEV
jgi:hypothetical protein